MVGDHLFGAVAEESGRLTTLIPLERAAVKHVGGRIGCLAIDSSDLQCRRIADEFVPDTVDDDRIVGRDGVEVVAGGVAPFGEETLIPATPDDPLSLRHFPYSRCYPRH